jgi:hypothetical protein
MGKGEERREITSMKDAKVWESQLAETSLCYLKANDSVSIGPEMLN